MTSKDQAVPLLPAAWRLLTSSPPYTVPKFPCFLKFDLAMGDYHYTLHMLLEELNKNSVQTVLVHVFVAFVALEPLSLEEFSTQFRWMNKMDE